MRSLRGRSRERDGGTGCSGGSGGCRAPCWRAVPLVRSYSAAGRGPDRPASTTARSWTAYRLGLDRKLGPFSASRPHGDILVLWEERRRIAGLGDRHHGVPEGVRVLSRGGFERWSRIEKLDGSPPSGAPGGREPVTIFHRSRWFRSAPKQLSGSEVSAAVTDSSCVLGLALHVGAERVRRGPPSAGSWSTTPDEDKSPRALLGPDAGLAPSDWSTPSFRPRRRGDGPAL